VTSWLLGKGVFMGWAPMALKRWLELIRRRLGPATTNYNEAAEIALE